MGAGCRCLCGVICVVLGMDRLIKKKVSFVGTMLDEGACGLTGSSHWLEYSYPEEIGC